MPRLLRWVGALVGGEHGRIGKAGGLERKSEEIQKSYKDALL